MQHVPAGKSLIDLLAIAYRANLPVLVHGHRGIGKSELFRETAAVLGIGLTICDLSVMEPPDLEGLPYIDAHGRTRYAAPSVLPVDGAGILLFEELNRCPRYMQAPCFQLLTARKLNDYQLPSGWLPCAAVNDAEDGYFVEDLDPALLSRFLNAKVVPDVQEWVAWAQRTGIHVKIIDFVHNSPGVFADPDANPRAWHYASNFLTSWEQGERQQDLLSFGLVGVLGDKWALAFIQTYLDQRRPLQPAEIIEAYPAHRASLRAWVKKRHTDVVAASLELIKRHLQPQRTYDAITANASQKANVEMFFSDLPPDLKRQVISWLEDRGFQKLTVPPSHFKETKYA